MKIPLSQILKDKGVERTICLIVQAELEETNKRMLEKMEYLEKAKNEIILLNGRIMELEKANLVKDEKLKNLIKELKAVNKAGRRGGGSIVGEQPLLNTNLIDHIVGIPSDASCKTAKDIELHGEDLRKCGWFCLCGQEYRSKQSLHMHIKYFDAGYKFSCNRCPTRFVYATDMRKHLRTVHKIQPDPSMRYGCRQCGSFFRKITDLLKHRKRNHMKTKIFKDRPNRIEKRNDTACKVETAPTPGTNPQDNMQFKGHGFAALLKASKIGGTDNNTNKTKKEGEPLPIKTMLKQSHRYICHCGKSYSSLRELRRHARKMDEIQQNNQ